MLKKYQKSIYASNILGSINDQKLAKCMDLGADKIGLNSTAIENPKLIRTLSRQFGSQSIIIGLI